MRTFAIAGLALCLTTARANSQQPASPAPPPPTGWELFAIPTLNFSSDEGAGYGALAELYNYGSGVSPYKYMLRPLVLFTSKGRREFTLTFDAPKLLSNGWRVDAFAGYEQLLATPYYGIGPGTTFDESLDEPPNPYFYRYGQTQTRLRANIQRPIGTRPMRVLAGVGFTSATTDATPHDSGSTLLLQELQAQQGVVNVVTPRGQVAFVRAGVVWDTRDREIGPSRGSWAEILVQRADEAIGSSTSYTRVTGTARKYWSLSRRLVFAQRLLAQQTSGDVRLYDLSTIQTSAMQNQEGLGGSSSVRGLPKNRFMGKGIFFSNSELRWQAMDFTVRRKPARMVLTGFADAGRVWTQTIDAGELFSDLHAGYGGGLRLGLGPSFLIAFDLGKSSESTQIYIGLGYAF